jgi:N-acetyl-S-(2-succino)cysteine monooxygenase
MSDNGQMRLGAFFNPTGHHVASWRHPRSQADAGINFQHYVEITRTAERAKFDMVFLADNVCVREANMEALSRSAQYIANFEPLTLLSALSAVTSQIGLVATASTSYNEPFHVARKFASLDHLSGGRAGWNIVTSGQEREAHNFGLPAHPPHAARYRRAAEFVEVTLDLWDSWEDGALLFDTGSGRFADPARVHPIDHHGPEFRVRGPLNVPRPPQGRPLLVQAGSSEDGKDIAARYAEAVFTAQQTLADGQDFYRDLKARTAAAGRDPALLKILPGICPVIGATEADAAALATQLERLIVPDYALAQLSGILNVDLRDHPLDGPLPPLPGEHTTEAHQSRYKLVLDLARRENLTIRELIGRLGGGRGHRVVAGTPERIAEELEVWFTQGAADGFNVMPPHLPGGLADFVDHVVPLLRRRGLFRTAYTGRTLREHYGLPRPASRYADRVPV